MVVVLRGEIVAKRLVWRGRDWIIVRSADRPLRTFFARDEWSRDHGPFESADKAEDWVRTSRRHGEE